MSLELIPKDWKSLMPPTTPKMLNVDPALIESASQHPNC